LKLKNEQLINENDLLKNDNILDSEEHTQLKLKNEQLINENDLLKVQVRDLLSNQTSSLIDDNDQLDDE